MKLTELIKKDFLSFESDDKLSNAARRLSSAGVSEAPVLQKKKYLGMFSASDIARVLVKESVFGKPTAANFKARREDPLFKHMHHFSATLTPDSDIISAYLVLLHKNVDIIPVVNKNRTLAGVVRASDIRKKMSEMLSEGGKVPSRAQSAADNAQLSLETAAGNTSLDLVLQFVQKKGATTAKEVSDKFKIPENEIEEYALCLEKHGLLKIEYDFFGKMKLRKAEAGA